MPVGVCVVRSEMAVSVSMRDRMGVDIAVVEMCEGVPARQWRGRLAVMSVQKREKRNADARAEIERRGHGGWPDIPQQHL